MSNLELDVIRRAQAGEEKAFDELYQMFYKQAYYLALKITNCDADAQDAAQESFITIQSAIKDLREIKTFRKWMAQIVVSKCNKIFRKNKYKILDPDIMDALPMEEKRDYMTGVNYTKRKHRKELLVEIMSNLTPHQRDVLVLMYFEQLSIKEISEVLDIPDGTVKSRLVSAKDAMKKQIKDMNMMDTLRFHVCPLPLLLMLAYRKEFMTITGGKLHIPISSSAILQPITLTTLAIGSAAGISYAGYQAYEATRLREPLPQILYKDDSGTYSEKEIYHNNLKI